MLLKTFIIFFLLLNIFENKFYIVKKIGLHKKRHYAVPIDKIAFLNL